MSWYVLLVKHSRVRCSNYANISQDTGLTKVMQYNPRLRSRTLRITPYSKANATQRAGRAGRTAPGTCYRLYAREDFDRLLDKPRTQISQSEAGNTILTLLALGVESIWKFNFIDPPAAESMYVLMKYSLA